MHIKVILSCTVDHQSLKRALDSGATSEFRPLIMVNLIPGYIVFFVE